MKIRISVVIPCYNQAHFLAEAVQSVLAQARDDVEVIVVNDGSPDNTAEVVAQFGDRIVYVAQANRGLSGARNTGIRAAQGEYIGFLDADDQYLPGALTALAGYLDQHPETAFVCGDALTYGDGPSTLWSFSNNAPRHHQDFRWETVFYTPSPCTTLVRRTVFDVTGYFDESLRIGAEDWMMGIQVARCFGMAYLPMPLMLRRVHPASVTHQLNKIAEGNRQAMRAAIASPHFAEYPRFFQAQLLYVDCAMHWKVRPRSESLRVLGRAFRTDPSQVLVPVRILWRKFRYTDAGRVVRRAWRRLRQAVRPSTPRLPQDG